MCWNRNKTNNNKPEQKSTNDRCVNFIFIGVMVVMCLIVCCAVWMFFEECRYEVKYAKWYDEYMKKCDSMCLEVMSTDSVLSNIIAVNENQNSQVKDTTANSQVTKIEVEEYLIPLSEVLKIRKSQKLLLIRQEQLIDDVRQETNNIINKMNGWLGFWMGAMAILGVFVPIALQLKLYRENRDDVDKFEKRIKDLSDSNKMLRVQFAAKIRCFHNIMDSPEIRTNDLRNQLLAKNWDEIVTEVKQYIDCYFDPDKDYVNSYVMSDMLLQVASLLTSLKLLIPRRMRQLDSLSYESYNIIRALNTVPIDNKDIIDRLKNYQESLSSLKPMSY